MGYTVEINSLEEMCDAMCDNVLPEKQTGTYECFHCMTRNVVWNGDFDFEDFGYEGEGIVHCLTCANCVAEITYAIRIEDEDDG